MEMDGNLVAPLKHLDVHLGLHVHSVALQTVTHSHKIKVFMLSIPQRSCTPKGRIVDELQELVYFASSASSDKFWWKGNGLISTAFKLGHAEPLLRGVSHSKRKPCMLELKYSFLLLSEEDVGIAPNLPHLSTPSLCPCS